MVRFRRMTPKKTIHRWLLFAAFLGAFIPALADGKAEIAAFLLLIFGFLAFLTVHKPRRR
jgi:hypothetical protein